MDIFLTSTRNMPMYEQAQRIMPIASKDNSDKLKIHQPKILLVEDHPMLQIINKKLLEMLNCLVDIAANGEQAIKIFNSTYDLVLLDIGLPDISGIEVCKTIRASSDGEGIPIVALTALGNIIKDECFAAGVNHVATKPVLIEGLEDILVTWVHNQNT